MAKSNRDRVGASLELLRDGLYPFMERELKAKYGKGWKKEATSDLRHVPKGQWDASACLAVLCNCWNAVFRDVLSNADRTLAFELRDVRNNWAHQKAFTYDDTYRALDSMSRLLQSVGAGELAAELDKQKREVLQVQFSEQARTETRKAAKAAETSGDPASGLAPWRDVIEPHEDVASGNYLNAEFAADLYQVWKGEASAEYLDPKEFYRRTYLTHGLRELLSTAIKRLADQGGDPVVALQTNFGGGKTHSMLALYHLFDGKTPAQELANVDQLMSELGVAALPTVKRAVLVGQYLSPGSTRRMEDGTKVNTLWGELAWQLGGKKGYKLIEEADRTATNPGEKLVDLFRMVGPCLVLIDEWVAYARQLYEKHDLPAGSFDTQFTFAQALTEAARAAKGVLLVMSVPASDIETGGTAGKEALTRLENVVSRLQATWQPATSEEGFEIVRRRLFKPMDGDNYRKRDAVVNAFCDYYRRHGKEFPTGTGSADYYKRMVAAYPVHPDVFDRLYNEWSTLDRFQRTRGVLRLMAAVIHELWEREDKNLLILPGTLPIYATAVRKELLTYLEPTWQAVVETDVDGTESTPMKIDRDNTNLGRYSAARRVARAVFLGTAPLKGAASRGKDIRQICLGCVQPGETIQTFGDALRRLQSQATYLNVEGERNYYDTAQNINREAESRKAGFSDEDVQDAIRVVVKGFERPRGEFAKVHACPQSPSDVGDEKEARLVILGPEAAHTANKEDSPAISTAKELLAFRGSSPRLFKNTLVFLAADTTRLQDLADAMRWQMSWESILSKAEELDLTKTQIKTAQTQSYNWKQTVQQRVGETFCWLIVPGQADPRGEVEWRASRLSGQDALAERASKRVVRDENLVTNLGGVTLRMALDRVPLWRGDDVPIKQLADDFAKYLYLSRLRSPELLAGAIADGVNLTTWQSDTFAFAEAKNEKGRYLGLRCGENLAVSIDGPGMLVKPDVAAGQRAEESKHVDSDEGSPAVSAKIDTSNGLNTSDPEALDPAPMPTRYFASSELNVARIGRDAGNIGQEVLAHLAALEGASVRVTLEIEATVPQGIDAQVVRVVSENARTLGFGASQFERD